jgi:hypothetical protein
VVVRDGYAGYAHLPAIHPWCAAHVSQAPLPSVYAADPTGPLWVTAMAGPHTALAEQARTLIARLHRFEDMILRFTLQPVHSVHEQRNRERTPTHEDPTAHLRQLREWLSAGLWVGGSHGPVVKSRRRRSSLSRPHWVTVSM